MMTNQITKLASAKDDMVVKTPFWPESWFKNVSAGTNVIMVPPMAKMPAPVIIDLAKTGDCLVAVGDGAEVIIKEICSGAIISGKVCIMLDGEAKVTYLIDEIETRGSGQNLVVEREAILEAGAEIDWYCATFNQSGYQTKVRSWLKGENGRSDMYWLNCARADEVVEIELVNCFDAPNCRGQIYVKGVAQDRANVKIVGGIEITLNGGGADSYLKEDTLLLDNEARIRALPCLEIKTNEVKAGHGATITNLTPEDLFYLQAHGIEAKLAKKLMVQGFLQSVLQHCPDQEFLDKVFKMLSYED
ncbi:hypothetical protein COV81_03760 [Candidatus Peregrinibacteria bacterium CG11_big_fil_rev_8_21_14_0_20_41_10]|nr:MAG: hypothetical protein COV81_03760 [Candidatus Peregrinibacteria bacterium CG11_big_fil_rev_8_21_14_0_20_41_10]PIZ73657.1 MAG: hypothetical protein COY06_05130 [Candidatus Peregrinibacteria bacterium CG_4_10_14_0_2_um_filter_41_8]PJC38394.1 MAG: hypothetical protein CO045_00520 [Candidatus Peregrinibacteria bacterium CG_4_9_14_0_2_um_filter_41_14]